MRSRMIAIAVGFLCAAWQPQVIPITGCICIALLTLVYAFYGRSSYKPFFICCCAAFLYASCWGHWQLSHKLPDQLLRSDWVVSGKLVGLPNVEEGVIRFNLDVKSMELLRLSASSQISIQKANAITDTDLNVRLLKLAWYKPTKDLIPGQYIKLIVRLKPPHSLVNPSGFDYERWLLTHKIDATGYVREFLGSEDYMDQGVTSLRYAINKLIESRYEEPSDRALVQALVTGYKDNLSQDDWEKLRESGTVHLAVISGLHIGFIALVGWWLGRILSAFTPRLYYLPYLLSVVLAGLYMQIAGGEVPTQRAFIMVLVFTLSGLLKWYIDIWQRWWLALVCVLIFSPLAVLEMGFWLSFSAVALLIWFGQQPVRWYSIIKIQFLLLIGMLPFYLYFFSGVSLIAPLVNIIAIPLLSFLIVIIAVNLVFSGFSIPLLSQCESALVDLFWTLVDMSANQAWAYLVIDYPSLEAIVFAAIGVIILIMPSGLVPKYLALFCFLSLVSHEPFIDYAVDKKAVDDKNFSAIVFDIGQGLSVLIEVGEYRVLYDTGASYPSGLSAFERAALPYFKQKKIKQLDYMILSHNDNDHVGGFAKIKQWVDIKTIFSSFHPTNQKIKTCQEGVRWKINGVDFEFLAGSKGRNDNDRSCVLLISNGDCSLLLPGDISKAVESKMVLKHKRLKIDQPLTWLVASHHGSRTSSSDTFLTVILPKHVIFSAGYGNAFNHPHPEVVRRAKSYAAHTYTTAIDGAVLLKSEAGQACSTTTMRKDEKRFWR
ncbi:DNA internalization-related competence protein ComEC/Rec2 [Neptuniibacter marinus]|uniref:DNA internalization-related competence protein ComEC/Rec2 n=1 Tax=Neptuniibacter marinus TaxID=1806670 RepID=UPI0009EED191|nr:DNA internalization-related competence protein ComEC/Rec2 [Neptuniibacter marinus]